jgi:hypothetical protein
MEGTVTHPLDGAHAKVARARENLKELDRKSVAFVQAHPYVVAPEIDPQTGQLVGILRAQVKEDPIPLELGVIAGEVGHNLRSALNYLTLCLAEPPIGTGAGDSTQFPIFYDPPGSTYKKPARQRFREGENKYLYGVRPVHRTLIEKAQPYNGRHREHLAFLAVLNNGDKHRLPTPTGILGHIEPPDLGDYHGKMLAHINRTPAVHDGAEVFRVVGAAFDGDAAQVHMKFDPAYEIGFGDNPMIGTTNTMWRAAHFVELVLRVFHRVFV